MNPDCSSSRYWPSMTPNWYLPQAPSYFSMPGLQIESAKNSGLYSHPIFLDPVSQMPTSRVPVHFSRAASPGSSSDLCSAAIRNNLRHHDVFPQGSKPLHPVDGRDVSTESAFYNQPFENPEAKVKGTVQIEKFLYFIDSHLF